MASYVPPTGVLYSALLEGPAVEIRLVAVQPGQWSDEIRCDLFHTPLVEDCHPPYRALSYAWGLPSRASPRVTVNGLDFAVTANLELALRYLRKESETVILWVDAIVILPSIAVSIGFTS